MKHAPCDFPVEQMVTWQQIVDLWGGGEYQAIGKDAQHRVLRHYPPGGKWMSFAGEPKPLVRPPLARRAVDDARASILPSGVLPQRPDRGLVRDIELGQRVGLPNPVDIRPRIARLIRQGALPKTGVIRAADGARLLSREAAVLVTMRLKLKRRVQLEVVAALLGGGEPETAGATNVPLVPAQPPVASGPVPTPSGAEDTPKLHPVLGDRVDETSRRLTVLEDQDRQIEARLARLESRPPWLA